jgi:hypothetical protein
MWRQIVVHAFHCLAFSDFNCFRRIFERLNSDLRYGAGSGATGSDFRLRLVSLSSGVRFSFLARAVALLLTEV